MKLKISKRKLDKMPWYSLVLFTKDWGQVQAISVLQIKLLSIDIKNMESTEYKKLVKKKKNILWRLLMLEPNNPILLDAYSDTLVWRKNILKYKLLAIQNVRNDDDELNNQLDKDIIQIKNEISLMKKASNRR